MTEKRKFLHRSVGSSISGILIWFVHEKSVSLPLVERGISGGDGVEFIPHVIVFKFLVGDSSKISEVELDLSLLALAVSSSLTLSLLNLKFSVGGTDLVGFKIGRSSLGLHSITLDTEV